MREAFEKLCRGELKRFQFMLVMHADLRLQDIYSFSLDDAAQAYGDESCRAGLGQLLRTWSYRFGDLDDRDPKHFIYTNPVLQRPLISIGE